jgi:predicted acetyltransferase
VAGFEIRTLDEGDLEAVGDLAAIAFGGPRRTLTTENLAFPVSGTVAAYVGTRLVGTLGTIDFTQWFGGRELRCAGVAGVTVAPDQRGQGVARALLAEALSRMQAAAQPVSALYPTTASLYRSLGWEISGWWTQVAVPVADMPHAPGAVAWAPASHTDDALRCAYEGCAHGRDGWVVPPHDWWQGTGRRWEDGSTPSWAWVGRRDGDVVAAVVYHHRTSERWMYDVEAPLAVGTDGPALTDALAFLGSHGTTADRIVLNLPHRLVARHVAEGSRAKVIFDWPWMLRLVDIPAAMSARGWPAGVRVEVDLEVTPSSGSVAHAGAGRGRLRIADGEATWETGGEGTVIISVGDLASLYAGGVDPAALASDGRLTGADACTLSALRAAFAGDPTLPWFF